MTPEALAASLADVRIPESFARFGLQDALAACALGLLAGLLVSAPLARVTVRRVRPLDGARAAIAALARQDHGARIAGLAALLRAHGGTPPDGLDRALYDPRATIRPEPLEAAVLAAARQRPRR